MLRGSAREREFMEKPVANISGRMMREPGEIWPESKKVFDLPEIGSLVFPNGVVLATKDAHSWADRPC